MDSLNTANALVGLPPEAPLAMPTQSLRQPPLRQAPAGRASPASSPPGIAGRRLVVVGGAIALTAVGLWQMKLVLASAGLTPLAVFMLLLFAVLFAWIALSFTSALAGFVSLLAGGGHGPGLGSDAIPRPGTRTALLMPCYNENPTRVMAGLQAIWESLEAAGATEMFDIFVLSDTTNPEVWISEEEQFLDLRRRTGSDRIFYRHRAQNTGRKAGNIADWVTRWGGAYPHFLILDADSVMEARTLLHLAAMMQAHPDIGLIQTLPIITGGTTVFARLQQFAGRVYGPLIAHGIAWWHGAEGNYWGHNAIIRTAAFAEQAGLPELRGRKPIGGHILSHDFVEAALMRRGGWAIHLVPALAGSYEEGPPSLTDVAIRDRRWCQGNLQHLGVLPARGLHWISRVHLLTGIGAYITAPLWLLFLLAGIVNALQARFMIPNYFPDHGKALFPTWPVVDPVRAKWMFVATMALLLLPKLLACMVAIANRTTRRGSGGALRLVAGTLLESLISGLLAPVVMLTQSMHVLEIARGRDSGWNAQRRDDGALSLGDTARRYLGHTLLGAALGVAAWLVSASLALWMSPVVLGLLLAIPLAALSSRRDRILTAIGLLRIPEEVAPPPVLARAAALAGATRIGHPPAMPARLLSNPQLLAVHCALLPPPRRPWLDPLNVPLLVARAKVEEAPDIVAAWQAMTQAERIVWLSDADALKAARAAGQPVGGHVCPAPGAANPVKTRDSAAKPRGEPAAKAAR
jgi:membrane glycosyltransferase